MPDLKIFGMQLKKEGISIFIKNAVKEGNQKRLLARY